jgi:anti-sigma factor RsiW
MNCSRFARILADFEQGTLAPGERLSVEAHLESCQRCRRLLGTARGTIDLLAGEGGDALARSIMVRTSGPVCPRAESRLWEYVDGSLDATESQLIALHLEHCEGCRSIAAEFADAQQVLSAMAEIDPGPFFTREVFGLTSGRHARVSVFRTRFLAWWNRMVYRPRFALEAAYVGTLVLVLLFSTPLLPLRNLGYAKITSAAVQPVTGEVNRILLSVAAENRSARESMKQFALDCERILVSAATDSFNGVRGWERKQVKALSAAWARMSGRVRRTE